MIFFIELHRFDRDALAKLRWKMLADSTDEVRWVEWTADLSRICKQPDLTLIGPQRLSWIEVAKLANSAAGQQVVSVGDRQFTLGLQTLPLDFAMHELLPFIPWSTQGRAHQPTAAETSAKRQELDFKRTIPVGF